MTYIDPTLENALVHFHKLKEDTQPLWGNMDAISMIEHITDSLLLAQGKYTDVQLQIPEDKVEKAKAFLQSDHPLPKNFKAPYGNPGERNRNTSIVEAIEEFTSAWNTFESFFRNNPEIATLHPSFGELTYPEWSRMHSKHLTHHLQQFRLVPL